MCIIGFFYLFDLFDLVVSCQFTFWRAGPLTSWWKTTRTLIGGVRDIKQAHHRQISSDPGANSRQDPHCKPKMKETRRMRKKMRISSELLELRCAVARRWRRAPRAWWILLCACAAVALSVERIQVFIKNSRHWKTRRTWNFVRGAAKLHLRSSVRCNQAES